MSNPDNRIFVSYRALGFVSNHVPLSLRYIERRKENLAVTVVGKCFHTYSCSKLSLLTVSNPHPDDISTLASDSYLVFTSCKNVIYAWSRGTELIHQYEGHKADVHRLLVFGPHLISVDKNSTLIVWEIKNQKIHLEMIFENDNFCISTMVHPSLYFDQILLGSMQGSMQLWNLNKPERVRSYDGWNSEITVLEQSTAEDIVAVGLASGKIMLHHLKEDKTLMTFVQECGSVVSISFRTDGKTFLASGSGDGTIFIWNLDKKRLQSEIRNAHHGSVTGMAFLPNEPLLLTSSPDNTLKTWIFDLPDEGGRLLRLREGHSKPPSKIQFYGQHGNTILSSGFDSTIRSFSTVVDNLNTSLGQASYNRKITKKKGVNHDPAKMPPVVNFASETIREKQWDNIAACHRGLGIVTTWSYDKCRMGAHKILAERFKNQPGILAECVTLSTCGNYVFIGYNSGHVDKFNIQSGIFQGTYGNEKAHDGNVRGIVTDAYNQVMISGSSDKQVKFWKLKERNLLAAVSVEHAVAQMIVDRESALLAVALDNFTIIILDCDTRRVVRKFEEHYGRISDMALGMESHWLIVASMDSTIKIWDIKTGKLLDCFRVASPCVSLDMSPTSVHLATVHAGDLGVYLWVNKTLYSRTPLQPLPSDYEPEIVDLPAITLEGKTGIATGTDDFREEETMDMEHLPYQSPEQIDGLITLSEPPNFRWQTLLNLDTIKARNKPKQPLQVSKSAPFFLPVVSGLNPTFAIETEGQPKKKDTLMLQVLKQSSSFGEFLQKCDEIKKYDAVIEKLKTMSISLLDVEVRCLSPDTGGSLNCMICFMKAIDHGFRSAKNFELLQSVLGLFLQVHGLLLVSNEQLREQLEVLQQSQQECWTAIESKLNLCSSVLNFLRSSSIR